MTLRVWKSLLVLSFAVLPALACSQEGPRETPTSAPSTTASDEKTTLSLWVGPGEELIGPPMDLQPGEIRASYVFYHLEETNGEQAALRGYVFAGSPIVTLVDAVRETADGGHFTAAGTTLALKLDRKQQQILKEALKQQPAGSRDYVPASIKGKVVFTPEGWGPEPQTNGYVEVLRMDFVRMPNSKE